MNIHILSIFPESFDSFLNSSILKNSIKKNILNIYKYKLNDYSLKKTKRVDSRIYWWWAWCILQIEPLYLAVNSIINNFKESSKKWADLDWKIITFRPQWTLFNQEIAHKYANNSNKYNYLLVCGHYEWIDERFYKIFNPDEISIWEYILSGGEIPALIFIDSVNRLLDWVLWNDKSLNHESFSKELNWKLEYPQYWRPENFLKYSVPNILLSWDIKKIDAYNKSKLL